jgi:hypothetical protein
MRAADPRDPAPLPGLDELLRLAAARFPEASVSLIRPLMAEPFVMISHGLFAAVFLRPDGEAIRSRAALPHSGWLAALGPLAGLFGRSERSALLKQVVQWARNEMGWSLVDG